MIGPERLEAFTRTTIISETVFHRFRMVANYEAIIKLGCFLSPGDIIMYVKET